MAVAVVLGMTGTAVAASPALAYHINYSQTGAAVPVGTSYTATSGTIAFTNSSGGTIASCPSSTLGGATTGSGGISNGLSVTSGTFNATCRNASTGATLGVTGNFSPPWQITPTSGAGPITVKATISFTLICGTSSETYAGTVVGTWSNASSGAQIAFNDAGPLNETGMTGSGCGYPASLYYSATYTVRTVGGSPVSSTNDLWLLN